MAHSGLKSILNLQLGYCKLLQKEPSAREVGIYCLELSEFTIFYILQVLRASREPRIF